MWIVRAMQFFNHGVPHGYNAAVLIPFGAAGFVNAILFFSTGRRFGFSDGRRNKVGKETSSPMTIPGVAALENV